MINFSSVKFIFLGPVFRKVINSTQVLTRNVLANHLGKYFRMKIDPYNELIVMSNNLIHFNI